VLLCFALLLPVCWLPSSEQHPVRSRGGASPALGSLPGAQQCSGRGQHPRRLWPSRGSGTKRQRHLAGAAAAVSQQQHCCSPWEPRGLPLTATHCAVLREASREAWCSTMKLWTAPRDILRHLSSSSEADPHVARIPVWATRATAGSP